MKEENNKNFVSESKEDTPAKPLSKVEQMEKALEEMNTRNGWKSKKGEPQQCTIIFKSK